PEFSDDSWQDRDWEPGGIVSTVLRDIGRRARACSSVVDPNRASLMDEAISRVAKAYQRPFLMIGRSAAYSRYARVPIVMSEMPIRTSALVGHVLGPIGLRASPAWPK